MNQWRLEGLRYRIIFGDISTLDVSVDELAQLEKLTPG